MRKILPFASILFVALLFSSLRGSSQTCSLVTHNSFTDFNGTKSAIPTSLWLNIHTKLNNTNLVANGDYLLFSGGTISLNGVTSTPAVSGVSIPNGMIIADNTVTKPVTSFDLVSNSWITKVPLGYSSSDIFISAAIINSSTGFQVGAGKSSTISGYFFSNRPSFKQSWFYGLATYQPEFSYSDVAGDGEVASIGGGIKAGTPIPEESNLVAGGSGGGGSNFTGSNSSTDNFFTCQQQVCNSTITVSATVLNGDFENSCDGAAVITVTGGVGPFTFVWSDGVTTTSNERDNLCGPPPGSGVPVKYTVVVTDANGCSGNTFFFIDVTTIPPNRRIITSPITGNNTQYTGPLMARIYHDPSSNLAHLIINSSERSSAKVNVIDINGRVVKSVMLNLEVGTNNKDVQLPGFSRGIYMFQIKTNKEIKSVPLWFN